MFWSRSPKSRWPSSPEMWSDRQAAPPASDPPAQSPDKALGKSGECIATHCCAAGVHCMCVQSYLFVHIFTWRCSGTVVDDKLKVLLKLIGTVVVSLCTTVNSWGKVIVMIIIITLLRCRLFRNSRARTEWDCLVVTSPGELTPHIPLFRNSCTSRARPGWDCRVVTRPAKIIFPPDLPK